MKSSGRFVCCRQTRIKSGGRVEFWLRARGTMWAHSSISLHLDSKQWKYDNKLPEYHILESKK